MNKEIFTTELLKLGITINQEQLKQLSTYYDLLVAENKKYNLTAITEESQVYLKHFYDSLTILKSHSIDNQYFCDVGTGAGFPGLVLKIIFPNIKIDLIDATNKKCEFLKKVINTLSLTNINVINARVEEYSKTNREKYDIVVSRAVAPLKHLLEYSVPMLKINGYFIALKSNIDLEISNIDRYYQKLFLTDESIIKFILPYENSNRTIYSVKKIDQTPMIYPRPYSQIKKREL